MDFFFLFVAIKAFVTHPEVQNQLSEAPFITDGKVDPNNEGKIVVVVVPLSSLQGAKDDLFGFSFDFPMVKRKVEKLTYISSDRIVWEPVYEDTDENIGGATFYGDVGGMEFEIGEGMLNGLSNVKNLKREDFNSEELSDFLEYYNALDVYEYHDILYIADTDEKYFKDFERGNDDESSSAPDRKYREYSDEVGALRVHYQGITGEKGIDAVALVGKQVGNKLIKTDDIDSMSCYENVHTRDELLHENDFWVKLGAGFGLIFNAGLVIAGVLLIVIKSKEE